MQALAAPLDKLLDQEPKLRAALRAAERAVIRASALVRTADGVADDHLSELGKDVVSAVRQDRSAPLYKAIFGDRTPTEMIALSLTPEVTEIDRIVKVLKEASTPAALRKKWAPVLEQDAKRGRDALAAREAAADANAKSDARRWIDLADRARRSADGALRTYSAEQALRSDYNDRFFPSAPTRRKKPAKDVAPGSNGAHTNDAPQARRRADPLLDLRRAASTRGPHTLHLARARQLSGAPSQIHSTSACTSASASGGAPNGICPP